HATNPLGLISSALFDVIEKGSGSRFDKPVFNKYYDLIQYGLASNVTGSYPSGTLPLQVARLNAPWFTDMIGNIYNKDDQANRIDTYTTSFNYLARQVISIDQEVSNIANNPKKDKTKKSRI